MTRPVSPNPVSPRLAPEDIEQTFADSLQLLRSVRRTLIALLDRIDGGEDGLLKDVTQKQSELEAALRRAFEAEERFNDWQARSQGIRNACEIDFAALREEIACRLQTLHDCCQEGA